ncbi:MAG TPA: uracil-DNA glycosylase [Verrucomicrobiae bacterium]|nr:uracil-DNA glycosylase [Verrucomicrobiae bacterium]
MAENESRELLASLRRYMEELRDTGVEALPLYSPAGMPAAAPAQEAAPVAETLEDVRLEMGDCRRCSLAGGRTNLVFGTGDPAARLVFVGEAPGRDEDLQGAPFVGEAGQLLTRMIQAMGFAREEVYICNVLKCRPPGNRNPQPEEIEPCRPFLLRQLRAIAPEVLVALGSFAAQTLLETREPISRLRGRFHDFGGIPLMPTFHPAYLLRNPEAKREVWEDLQKVMKLLGKEVKKRG